MPVQGTRLTTCGIEDHLFSYSLIHQVLFSWADAPEMSWSKLFWLPLTGQNDVPCDGMGHQTADHGQISTWQPFGNSAWPFLWDEMTKYETLLPDQPTIWRKPAYSVDWVCLKSFISFVIQWTSLGHPPFLQQNRWGNTATGPWRPEELGLVGDTARPHPSMLVFKDQVTRANGVAFGPESVNLVSSNPGPWTSRK